MSEQESNDLIAVRLDAERRREIDEVKKRMEEFLRAQINVTHSLQMVVQGQDALKQRFEEGTAKTLKSLDGKFDSFMIEWGTKKAEDNTRDKRLDTVEKSSEKANEKFDGINKGLLWVGIIGAVMFLMKILITWKP